MCKVIVEIDLGDHISSQTLYDNDFFEQRDDDQRTVIVIDEAFLTRHEDDSFFEFTFIKVRSAGA